jgi:methyl-accepting chemotaxis protein
MIKIRSGLQTRLTALFILLAVIPLVIAGFIVYYQDSRSFAKDAEAQLQLITSAKAEYITNLMAQKKMMIETAATLPAITEAVSRFLSSADPAAQEQMQSLTGLLNEQYGLDTSFITNLKGDLIAASFPGMQGNFADRGYFRELMQTGNAAWGDVLLSVATNHRVIPLAVPIKHNGKIVGVFVSSLKLDDISRAVLETRVGETGYGYIIDKTGLVLVHPEDDKVLQENFAHTATGEFKNVVAGMINAQTGIDRYVYEGIDKYCAYQPCGEQGWSLSYNVPAREVLGAAVASRNLILTLVVLCALAAACLGVYFSKGIAQPIVSLAEISDQMAAGDLRVSQLKVAAKDELGRLAASFQRMSGSVRSAVLQVQEGAEQVAAASRELSAGAEETAGSIVEVTNSMQQLAAGAEQQSASVEETSGMMDEMAANIRQVSAATQRNAEAVTGVYQAAEKGNYALQEATRQMGSISEKTNHSAGIIKKLGTQSHKIGQIVDVITGIADQTNLLALNAAIEAARAGEQGRGFAVVAEEVRKLAEQSASAAKEIENLISEIQGDTEKAVTAMEAGTKEVAAGIEVVNRTDVALGEILSMAKEVAEEAGQAVYVLQGMAQAADEVVTAVNEVAKVAQNSAASSQEVAAAAEQQSATIEEVSASAESLAHIAQDLKKAVGIFQV